MLFRSKIDYILEDRNDALNSQLFYRCQNLRNAKYGKNIITIDAFKNYQIKDHDLYAGMKDLVRCQPDHILVITASGGTTGDPTVVKETHSKIMLMSNYTSTNQNFEHEEKVMHTNNLHHGSSMCLYFLPSLFTCWQHYFCALDSPGRYKKFVDFCVSEKINRLFLFTSQLLEKFLNAVPKINYSLRILTLYQITPDFVK